MVNAAGNVLLVEDNDGDARLLRELLSEDHRTVWKLGRAIRLADAIALLEETEFDVILLDLTLPDARGIETVRRLREAASRVPVVVLTGQHDEAFGITSVREGAQDYLIKGQIETPVLVRSLRYAIERFSLELQLRHSQKMEAVGRLAAEIAHDFNNTLAVIQGHVDLARFGDAPESRDRSLDKILDAAGRARELVKQLLMFGRNGNLCLEPVNLGDLVEEVLRGLPSGAQEKKIIIESHVESSPVFVLADKSMLDRVLLNLVFNARDVVSDGGRIDVSVFAEEIDKSGTRGGPEARPGRFGCLRVTDDGCGMDNETLSRIFEPFFTTKDSGKGTGLGLSAVYGIVRNHQGWIDVNSHPGTGTTFNIYLPLADAGESP